MRYGRQQEYNRHARCWQSEKRMKDVMPICRIANGRLLVSVGKIHFQVQQIRTYMHGYLMRVG